MESFLVPLPLHWESLTEAPSRPGSIYPLCLEHPLSSSTLCGCPYPCLPPPPRVCPSWKPFHATPTPSQPQGAIAWSHCGTCHTVLSPDFLSDQCPLKVERWLVHGCPAMPHLSSGALGSLSLFCAALWHPHVHLRDAIWGVTSLQPPCPPPSLFCCPPFSTFPSIAIY